MAIRPRSLAAIRLLERMQTQQVDRIGRPPELAHDPRVLREIAERQLMAERLDAAAFASTQDMSAALVELVSEPGYAAAVDARTQALESYYLGDDGDIWSRYERPDHRKRLSERVARVEPASERCGYAIPRRPTVGTLPTRDVNAQAVTGPPGEGHLVIFETGLFNFTSAIATLAAQAVDARLSDDGDRFQYLGLSDVGAHVARVPGILAQFIDVLYSHAVLGTCSYVAAYPAPSRNAPWAECFSDAMETFVLAHEYGHVILGHVDLPRVYDRQDVLPAHQLEFDADRLAFDICSVACYGTAWAAAGATLFLTAADIAARASAVFVSGTDAVEPSASHPDGGQRLAALRTAIAATKPAESEAAVRLSDTLDAVLRKFWEFARPMFESAYRDGYLPVGYRPRDELEKAASLQAFIGG